MKVLVRSAFLSVRKEGEKEEKNNRYEKTPWCKFTNEKSNRNLS